jgi:RNA polymerase sigma-70 factor (ECF subfamily)
MPEAAEEFGDLLARARRGEQEALTLLVQQYEPKVRMVARVLLGPALRPHLDSVDLVQSLHKSLLLGLRQGKYAISGPDSLLALALTLVRRKAARHWRRLRRYRRLGSGSGETGSTADLLTSLSSPRDDPSQAAQFHDQVEHLWANMNEVERRLLELRLEGYTTAEVALMLGLSTVALHVRLTRLRQRLRASGVLDDWL